MFWRSRKMGILHSQKREDEEGERPKHPVFLHRRPNHYNPYGDSSRSSERLLKMSNFGGLIYNAINGLLQKVCFIFCLPGLRKTVDPVLPIQNPASSINNEPILDQTPLISSATNDSSLDLIPESGPATFSFVAHLNTDDQESQCDNVDALSSQQWPEENYTADKKQKDHVIVSIPDFTCSLAYASVNEETICSAVFIEENAPKNGPFLEESIGMNSTEREVEEEREEEKVKIKRKQDIIYSAVFIEENAPKSGPFLEERIGNSTKRVVEEEREEEKVKIKRKEDIMCSAVFIEENAPKNAPFLEKSMWMNSTEREVEKQREEEKVKVKVKKKRKEEREEEKVKTKRMIMVDEGRWIKHYNSRHRILLVGEGDFSFSACLAEAFGSASNMIATSLDSKAFLKKNYFNAPSNIEVLRSRECKVMHGIDATKMANHALLGQLKFDRIVYNFPFAGFFTNLPRESQLRCHRRLVSLFLKSAREMISENGEVHISHKTNGFLGQWNLESLASSHRLKLIEAIKFNQLDYPGYNTKYGFGGDKNFNCNPSKTYKFGLKKGPVLASLHMEQC